MFELPNYAQAYLQSMGLGPDIFPHSPVDLFSQNISPVSPAGAPPQAPYELPKWEHGATPLPLPKGTSLLAKPSLMENPALSKSFISQEQERDAAMAQQPIARGVEMARTNPLSERIAPTEAQRDAAFRTGLSTFSHGMATMQSPSESTLYRIAANLNPAVAAYQNQLAQSQQNNFDMYKYEKEEAREAEKLKLEQKKVDILQQAENRKMTQDAYQSMTPYQQAVVKDRLRGGLTKIDERIEKSVNNYAKNVQKYGKEKDAAVEAERQRLEKKYNGQRKAIYKQMEELGLDVSDLYGEEQEVEDIASAVGAKQDGFIDINSIPRKEDGTFDLSGFTPEQKAMIAAGHVK